MYFDADGNLKLAYPTPIASHEFIVHPVPICDEVLHQHNDFLYVQLGNTNNDLNFVDTSVLLFFNQDTMFKKFDYPEAYRDRYLHYNGVQVDNINDTFFYIPAIGNTLSLRNMDETIERNISVREEDFLKFDTTKWNDVLYISRFTKATKQNLRLIANQNNVFLIQKIPAQKENTSKYYCLVFDHHLNLEMEFYLNEEIDFNAIASYPEGIIFFKPKTASILIWSKKLD